VKNPLDACFVEQFLAACDAVKRFALSIHRIAAQPALEPQGVDLQLVRNLGDGEDVQLALVRWE
jgi:hypothetical protein